MSPSNPRTDSSLKRSFPRRGPPGSHIYGSDRPSRKEPRGYSKCGPACVTIADGLWTTPLRNTSQFQWSRPLHARWPSPVAVHSARWPFILRHLAFRLWRWRPSGRTRNLNVPKSRQGPDQPHIPMGTHHRGTLCSLPKQAAKTPRHACSCLNRAAASY